MNIYKMGIVVRLCIDVLVVITRGGGVRSSNRIEWSMMGILHIEFWLLKGHATCVVFICRG